LYIWRRRTGHETSRQLSRIPTPPTSDRDKAGRRSFVPGPMPRPPRPRLPLPIKTPQAQPEIDARIEGTREEGAPMLTSSLGNRRRCAPPGNRSPRLLEGGGGGRGF
jgi:hypothetical protein